MEQNLADQNSKYSLPLRILHWIVAIIIFAIFCSGLIMSELDTEYLTLKRFLHYYHKSFGVLLFFLVLVRLVVRLTSKIPPYNHQMSKNIQKIAKVTHLLLYVLMFAVPLSGIGMVQLSSRKLIAFGLEVPNLFPLNKDLASILYECHQVFPYLLIGLVALHIAATLKHIFINKDDVFNRITIGFSYKK